MRYNVWHSFAARRTGQLAVSVLVLVTASFLMIHLVPGDPVRAALGTNAPPGLVSVRRAALGLNDPLWLQYVHYIGNLVTGNLGTSISSGLPVAQTIGEKLPPTLELATYSFLTAVIAAVPVGLAAAVLTRNKRKAELAFTTVGVLLAAVPGFLLAVGMVYVFSVQLHWTPVAEESGFSSFVLPVTAMAIGPAAPKGTNFASIRNPAYTADVTKATATADTAGCPMWNAAETALVKASDAVPFANSVIPTFAKGAVFQFSQGNVVPSSIRMLG